MRDFRSAKAMAQHLRAALSQRNMIITHGDALELVSGMFGVGDWNTLSAHIEGDKKAGAAPSTGGVAHPLMPLFPIKDTTPFPNMQIPLWIRRPSTIRALNKALANRRELALVAQKDPSVEDPQAGDIYDVGVMARVLDVGPPTDETIARAPTLAGTTQVLLQTLERVKIRNLSSNAGEFVGEVERIDEGAIQGAPDLIATAVERFEAYGAARGIPMPQIWPPLRHLNDPGRVAEILAHRMPLSVADKQAVLEARDPIARLEFVATRLRA